MLLDALQGIEGGSSGSSAAGPGETPAAALWRGRARPRRGGLHFGFVLPKIASYRDVIDVISGLSTWSIAALTAVTLWNVLTFAPPARRDPGSRLRRALMMTQASTAAASAMPGGEAGRPRAHVRDASDGRTPARSSPRPQW